MIYTINSIIYFTHLIVSQSMNPRTISDRYENKYILG